MKNLVYFCRRVDFRLHTKLFVIKRKHETDKP